MPPKAEIRDLLKKHRTERQKHKRVEHRWANYDGQGRLVCAVCHKHVKNESIWPAHLASAAHKANVQALKAQESGNTMEMKRHLPVNDDAEMPAFKRTRHGEGDEGDEGDEDDEDMDASQLPAGFFDNPQDEPTEEQEESEPKEEEKKESFSGDGNDLPVGFFDDASEEARIRKEPSSSRRLEDALDDEYEAFKKEMEELETTELDVKEDDNNDDDTLQAELDEEDLQKQMELSARIQQLKKIREEKTGPFPAKQSASIDSAESGILQNLKSSIRQQLKKKPAKETQSVFDDMDESDEDEDGEWEWRAQQL